MRYFFSLLIIVHCLNLASQAQTSDLTIGAERLDLYLHLLDGQSVALVVNQTSTIKNTHLVDSLLSLGVNVQRIFAPEHGFRGEQDAGETVQSGKDNRTGVEIVSLYGSNKKPSPTALDGIDVVIFDIQDVGVRFYTYISTLHYVMEGCAEAGIPIMVLDRPNPHGHYVAGPVLDLKHQSFVGMHPIPVVHGLTVGELADMINDEGWLENGYRCEVIVIPMAGWTHTTPYSLPVRPSPNLPNDQSIALYPSLCLFEGTNVSVGRGTNQQFQIIGHPNYPDKQFQFTPVSSPGAKYPPHENKVCFGLDLSDVAPPGFTLTHLIDFYNKLKDQPTPFFNNFFTKLAGNTTLQKQIEEGKSADEIEASWATEITKYKDIRKKYLLYEDFE